MIINSNQISPTLLKDFQSNATGNTLDTLNAALASAQNQLSSDEAALSALQQDSNMLSLVSVWNSVSQKFGHKRYTATFGYGSESALLAPDGSTLYHPWIDSNGQPWVGADSDQAFTSAESQIKTWQGKIAALQSTIANDDAANIKKAQDAIDAYSNTPAGKQGLQTQQTEAQTKQIQAQSEASQTTAANKQKNIMLIGGIGIGVVLIVMFFMHEKKTGSV